jgi:hypothetical protein
VLSDFLPRQHTALLPILGPRQAGRVLQATVAALAEDGIPAQGPANASTPITHGARVHGSKWGFTSD